MTSIRQGADQVGLAFRDPAEHKKRRLDPVPIEEVEEFEGRFPHPAFQVGPFVFADYVFEVTDTEPFFEVYAEYIVHFTS